MLVANRRNPQQQQKNQHLLVHQKMRPKEDEAMGEEAMIFECSICTLRSTPGASLVPVRDHIRMVLSMLGNGTEIVVGARGTENNYNKNNNNYGSTKAGDKTAAMENQNGYYQSSLSPDSSMGNGSMMKHFVQFSPQQSGGSQRSSTSSTSTCCCCADCFEFFRSVVVIHRDCQIPPQISCATGTGACPIVPQNSSSSTLNWKNNGINGHINESSKTPSQKNCLSCWLDRCALAGLRADAIAFLGVKFMSNKAKTRVGRLDKTLEKRVSALMSRSQTIVKRFEPDGAMLDFGLINSLLYVNKELTTLRLAAAGCVGSVLSLLDGRTTIDLLVDRRHPLLLGSTDNIRRMLMHSEEHFYSGVLPTSINYHSLHFPDAVTVHVEHSDPIFLWNFFNYLDDFLGFEYSHSMPVFQLLDTQDMILQLTYATSLCNALGNAAYSAQLQAPMLVLPGGFIPSVAVSSFMGKVRWAIANGGEYPARGHRGGKRTVAVKFLNNLGLIDEMERCARSYSVDFAEVFRRAQLTETEIALLRAMIITSPKTPGLSKNARILLDAEWKKHLKLLRSHLCRELGSADAAKRRVELLRGLIENELVDMKSDDWRYTMLLTSQLKVPLHFPPSPALPVVEDEHEESDGGGQQQHHRRHLEHQSIDAAEDDYHHLKKSIASCSSVQKKQRLFHFDGEPTDEEDNDGLLIHRLRETVNNTHGFQRRLLPPFLIDIAHSGVRIKRLVVHRQ